MPTLIKSKFALNLISIDRARGKAQLVGYGRGPDHVHSIAPNCTRSQ
ncbi:protein of unknown function [Vibrio tapetis subsp. tapetis]|uniref:Uncharacterized protein n=1 Tax=Vibrio tapetis subsp. tapetis TaxID=1671868 RepID=A0A2N8ZC67_9VIBR|nr:protein of unknown function [Vibrio tapetis subsp. tapetis]